jgi:hypothetical protein
MLTEKEEDIFTCASLLVLLQVKLFCAIVIKQQNISGTSECKSGVNPAQYRLL